MKSANYLSEHADFASHQYAVIDRVLFKQLSEILPVIELVTPLTAPQAHIYPWLLPLREITGTQWKNLIRDIQFSSDPAKIPMICLLLKSEQSPEAIKNSLLNMLIAKDERQRCHILRFYDPRVLFHLHWMLSAWEFNSRFNAREISNWTFWLEGQWHTLAYNQKPVVDTTNTAAVPFEKIQRIGLINQVLAELPLMSDIVVRQENCQRIETFLMQCPLSGEIDKIAFAMHGIIYGDEFWKAGKIIALLKESQNEPGYYARLTSGWNGADWQDALREDNLRNKASRYL